MKKIVFLIFSLFNLVAFSQTNASKVIYSNALTHCYVTAVAVDDSTVVYDVSEKSDRKIWRLTDREEIQSLGLLDKDTAIKLFESALELFELKELGKIIEINDNLSVSYVRIAGIKCVQIKNNIVNSSFNINKKTAIGALNAIKE